MKEIKIKRHQVDSSIYSSLIGNTGNIQQGLTEVAKAIAFLAVVLQEIHNAKVEEKSI